MIENSNLPKEAASLARRRGRGGQRKGAGRPSFRPSVEQRQTVEEMKFCGKSDAAIARAIGINVDTLRKHLRDELDDAVERRAARRSVLDPGPKPRGLGAGRGEIPLEDADAR